MSGAYRYVYLHGFASSPKSTKAVQLREVFAGFGLDLEVPDLNRPSFAKLSHAAMVAAVDELHRSGPMAGAKLRIVGSSLGGWLAARYAELHPDRVDRLVLLCPGFGLAARWPRILGEEWFALWERNGEIPMADATGVKVPVHFGFLEEARREPAAPSAACPVLILHGIHDETVPVQSSRDYVATHPRARLVELDTDHRMHDALDRIAAEVQRFFELGRVTLA